MNSQSLCGIKYINRDLSTCQDENGLKSAGSISAHTRPVECLDGYATSDSTGILYTADTMGVIKVWELSRDNETPPRWRATLKDELQHHRTRINEILYGNGQLWTGNEITQRPLAVLIDR